MKRFVTPLLCLTFLHCVFLNDDHDIEDSDDDNDIEDNDHDDYNEKVGSDLHPPTPLLRH